LRVQAGNHTIAKAPANVWSPTEDAQQREPLAAAVAAPICRHPVELLISQYGYRKSSPPVIPLIDRLRPLVGPVRPLVSMHASQFLSL
jgi:hypothetical protein